MLAADLIRTARLELIPLKSVDAAIAALPPASNVSVTCSPAKGIGTTLELAEQLVHAGHNVVPHLSARLFDSDKDLRAALRRINASGITEVFLVAGDSDIAHGPYDGVVALLRDLLAMDHGLTHIGVTSYPDGHPLIATDALNAALLDKQALLAEAKVQAHATTQMCFDIAKMNAWLSTQRHAGVTMPFHLGLPGVVDRTKLMTLGLRLGIGQSLRFLSKNKTSVRNLLRPGGYDPSSVLDPFEHDGSINAFDALHVFTFNEIAATVEWQRAHR